MSENFGEFVDEGLWDALLLNYPRLAEVVRQLVDAGQTPDQIAAKVARHPERPSDLIVGTVRSAARHLVRKRAG